MTAQSRIRPSADIPPYIIPQQSVPGEGVFDRQERRVGRSDWTRADYLEAGRAEFDRLFTASRAPTEGERDHYAQAYVALNCPPSKLPRPYPLQNGESR